MSELLSDVVVFVNPDGFYPQSSYKGCGAFAAVSQHRRRIEIERMQEYATAQN
ncbi:MAG: hypothetical protein JGK17_09325 [Microcoleus sp. PH2017_10_PVI_O_A]|uniref:hypothetical protein n=1 Tax=unclassified Microcoleus TaxID=2642155 RepID=UPI001DE658BF|nr:MULTISPECIES: hypothetical protein [unclassified Microcoleus]MCC3405777.1 hypothetical protein [Microcoleus sp. PH2017_10_PVI_O_A]MCC3459918.1 hypothetical protein [Microcoleus sp. PH2017_11_PCY_U_A]MCC3478282.1 hypothetical protein [Microcoleus sp. PH2017_12_PCY_D_A]MCC3528781.1 hypothetical protein [Microcoleus sp. PH2017_21_RUC_O_A]MCC3559285.1 hypothetical protein [Microcoleus sp. PH2017_27_LUM_O_A]